MMMDSDKFYRLLGTLQNGACLAGTFALGALGLACEGAEKLADTVRLRCQAARVEGEMDEKLMEAGEMVYATHTGTPTGSEDLLAKLQEIDALKARLSELNETLGRTATVCPDCGAAVKEADRFCGSCGVKLD